MSSPLPQESSPPRSWKHFPLVWIRICLCSASTNFFRSQRLCYFPFLMVCWTPSLEIGHFLLPKPCCTPSPKFYSSMIFCSFPSLRLYCWHILEPLDKFSRWNVRFVQEGWSTPSSCSCSPGERPQKEFNYCLCECATVWIIDGKPPIQHWPSFPALNLIVRQGGN